jgi:uncharacterized secreted repeat protein (TIGR03808 family)
MEKIARIDRRRVLGGLAALAALPPGMAVAAAARGGPAKPAASKPPAGPKPPAAPQAGFLTGTEFGIVPSSTDDQSAAVQAAFDAAHEQGRPLLLPAGQIFVQNLAFPARARIVGQPGQTVLVGRLDNPVGTAETAIDLMLEGVGFSAGVGGPGGERALLEVADSSGVLLSNCQFVLSNSSGLLLRNSAATIADCTFDQLDVAVFSHDSRGLIVRSNRISACANGGILIWRGQPGPDGSIVSGNRVSGILAKGGGNGQNGNAINVFRADNVIVEGNVIDDCDFSAVRINSARNASIRGNTCTNLREVGIYSEFAFTGSVISGNVVDGAAGGISITNLDQGGEIAVCTGNIVRNITANSPTNPDVTPYGIYAEANTSIVGNTVSAVPGPGIIAGYGPYLKNVVIADNVISDADTGIGVSVVDKAGAVKIAGNLISGAKSHAIVGLAWEKVVTPDLAADAAKYPNVAIVDNTVV